MLKKFLTISIIIFFSISLTTSSPFQNNNLIQNSFSVFGHYSIQIVYAVHTDDKDGDNGKDDEDDDDDKDDDNGKDDEDDDDDKDDDNGKDDEDDDDDENININFPYDSNSDFTNSPYLTGEDLLSSSSSTDDSSSEGSPLPSEVDKEKEEEEYEDEDEDVPSDFEDSSATNRDRFSGLVDLSNPPPFSRFQDPIPEQPGQPLHPDLPANPTLPPEAAEPRNPHIPPP